MDSERLALKTADRAGGELVRQVSEWQLLETAPRDGSKLDVWTENGFRYIDVFWYEGPAFPDGAFVYFDSQLRDFVDVDDATHWMRPPAPPRHENASPRFAAE
jgi:hypothetical protein